MRSAPFPTADDARRETLVESMAAGALLAVAIALAAAGAPIGSPLAGSG